MDPPCCEVKKHGVLDQVLVCPRQAETEVGLEEESLMAGLWTTSPAPYLYERMVVTERDTLPIDPPPKFVLLASWIDLFAQCADQIDVYLPFELNIQAWFPTTTSPMFQRLMLLTSLPAE